MQHKKKMLIITIEMMIQKTGWILTHQVQIEKKYGKMLAQDYIEYINKTSSYHITDHTSLSPELSAGVCDICLHVTS
jgi:hypothetical protein